jgi:hypothetical protein
MQFRGFFSRKPAALTGAPPVRRIKTYSAQSGYVYQYFYEGQRPFRHGIEFVFQISPDRKTWHATSVEVSDAAVCAWEKDNERQLSATERYAVAKLALFRAFDERPTPVEMKQAVRLLEAEVAAIVETLGL